MTYTHYNKLPAQVAGVLLGKMTKAQVDAALGCFDFYEVQATHLLMGSGLSSVCPTRLVQYRYQDKGRKQWGVVSAASSLDAYMKIIKCSTLLIGTQEGLDLAKQYNSTAIQWVVPNA